VHAARLDPVLCARIRASILLAAPLLARCGEVTLSPPGGDVIGRRRLDTHFHVLEQLGATYALGATFTFRAAALRGADVFLDEPSVTATENALMAAAAATRDDDAPQRGQRAARAGPRALPRRPRRADRGHRHEHAHRARGALAAGGTFGAADPSRSARTTSRSARSSASRR
jgi:hypothetical protein